MSESRQLSSPPKRTPIEMENRKAMGAAEVT